MPISKINTGASANDGTGDTLREAFEKVNGSLDMLAAAVAARLLDQWGFAPLHHEHDNAVARYVNNAPPSEPPPTFGAMWIDVAANRIYLATGTETPADWREIAFIGPRRETGG
jgi:hypothetical protein